MFIEAKDDGGGGDNWTTGAISRTKLQSNHHHPQTNIQFFLQAGCPSCRSTNSVKALFGHIPWTCLPQAHLRVFQLCLWPLIARGYLGGGLPCLSSAPWCQYPSKSLSLLLTTVYVVAFLWHFTLTVLKVKKFVHVFLILVCIFPASVLNVHKTVISNEQ